MYEDTARLVSAYCKEYYCKEDRKGMHTSSQNAVVLGNTYTWADTPGAGCTDLLTSGGKEKGR